MELNECQKPKSPINQLATRHRYVNWQFSIGERIGLDLRSEKWNQPLEFLTNAVDKSQKVYENTVTAKDFCKTSHN